MQLIYARESDSRNFTQVKICIEYTKFLRVSCYMLYSVFIHVLRAPLHVHVYRMNVFQQGCILSSNVTSCIYPEYLYYLRAALDVRALLY